MKQYYLRPAWIRDGAGFMLKHGCALRTILQPMQILITEYGLKPEIWKVQKILLPRIPNRLYFHDRQHGNGRATDSTGLCPSHPGVT
eukprot:scaffold378525_cov43-Prasinocladus_malaysianus.AAC.1